MSGLNDHALQMAQKAEQAERRAEDAEAEVERLRSLLAKVRRVFDLQCPPLLPAKYDSQGAWMAHTWWDRVLGAVLREVDACEWCGRSDGHANGCRLGLGPDEHGSECACVPPYANCSHPPCGCPDCVRGLRAVFEAFEQTAITTGSIAPSPTPVSASSAEPRRQDE